MLVYTDGNIAFGNIRYQQGVGWRGEKTNSIFDYMHILAEQQRLRWNCAYSSSLLHTRKWMAVFFWN